MRQWMAVVVCVMALLATGCGQGGGSGSPGPAGDGGEAGVAGDGTGGTGGTGDTGGTDGGASGWDAADFAVVYDVGPGQAYAEPAEVPWEALEPSTLVRIYSRPEPYRAKWVIHARGTADQPIVVLGVSEGGVKPVISGDGAVTRLELDYWNENRSVIKVGGSSKPAEAFVPAWVYVENLDIRSARPGYAFTDDAGSSSTYSSNAAAVHVEQGEHITVRGCELSDCGNGIFVGSQTSDMRIIGNSIHDNGIEGSIYEHNTYTEALGILYEANHFGPLRPGCGGNNLKDRSSGTVIRYNWIEGGNRQLDLVETGHDHILADPAYGATFVYGNVLVEPDGAGNSQIIHYGGDGNDGGGEGYYRKGTLHLYHNTVVSTRSGNTTLVRLSTDDVTVDIRDNVIYASAGAGRLAATTGVGTALLRDNWLQEGWRATHEATLSGVVEDLGNTTGADPGFADVSGQAFTPALGSPLRDAAGALAEAASAYPVTFQSRERTSVGARPDDGFPDIGAFER